MNIQDCSISGCSKPKHNVRGWCKMHYTRWCRHGDASRSSIQDKKGVIYKDDHVLISLDRDGKMFALVDKDSSVESHNWHYDGRYVTRHFKGGNISMHRQIMEEFLTDGLEVDHINRNTLDNRRENLRVVTRSINATNRVMSNNKSGVRGVVWDKSKGKWQAFGAINKKRRTLYSGSDFNLAVEKRLSWEEQNGLKTV